jgi:hypothetical protein
MTSQMKRALWVMAVMTGVVAATGAGYAQGPAAQQKAEAAIVPLRVTVVITRHKSDKAQTVLSRLPFDVWVNTGGTATLRFDSSMPVPTPTFMSGGAEGEKPKPVTSFSYRSMGTSLTVSDARALGDGRFMINLAIEDSQIVPAVSDPNVGGPTTGTQTHRTQASPVLRDGQTVQHSLVTDRVTGDVTKVEVTLNVVK